MEWVGEFTVLGLFNAFAYKTGLFADPWAQNLLGHLLLNTTIYPAAVVVMAAYSLKYGWISFVTVLFALLDYLFTKLGIYEHYWWRHYMTVIVVIVFLLIASKWFTRIRKGCRGLTRAVTLYFTALVIVHTPAPLLSLSGKQYYQIAFVNNWAGNLNLASITIIFFYHIVESLFLVVFTCVLRKWYWRLVPFIISIAVQSIFVRTNILIIKDDWNLIYTLVIYQIFIAIFILIEKHTLKPDPNNLST